MKSKFLSILFVFWMVSACGSTSQGSYSTEASSIPTSLPTHILTSSPSPTQVEIKPSVTPTLTLIPTLLPEEKVVEVERLQKTNGDCQWPCWWGITPGITTWPEASNFLQSLSIGITSVTKMPYIVYLTAFPRQDANKLFVDFYVQRQDNVIDVIQMGWDESLLDFLHAHGSPTEIWISSDGKVPMGNSVFTLSLFYPEKGWMVTYFGDAKLVSQDNVDYLMICGSGFSSRGGIWLWNPNSKKKFDELPTENLTGVPPAVSKLERIGEYTNLDEASFYNSVIQNPEKTCLKTQADIWPNPDLYTTPTP